MKKNKVTIGINSITLDNRHILLMDFDINKYHYKFLKQQLTRLINEFKLSNIYIVSSTNGYNAFCLDKFKFIFAHNILSQLSLLDKLYLSLSLEKKVFTLRTGKDKQFMCTIPSKYNEHEKSFAHYYFFSSIMEYPINNNGKFDDSTLLQIPLFRSSKYGIEMELIQNGTH